MKNILIKIVEWSYIAISWPFIWFIKRAISPRRFHHLLMGLSISLYMYLLNNYSYEMGEYLCIKTGWLFCNDNPPTRPELVAWRNMYGVPLFIACGLLFFGRFIKYIAKVNRRLNMVPGSKQRRKCMSRRWLWWL